MIFKLAADPHRQAQTFIHVSFAAVGKKIGILEYCNAKIMDLKEFHLLDNKEDFL